MGRKSQAREKLINTALQLIWEESYHAVSVKQICKKAGVKPGSFYYFFPSKHDLAVEALETHWKEAKEEILEPSFLEEIPPLERIKQLFERVYTFHLNRQKEGKQVIGCAFGSFVGELSEKDEVIRNHIQTILSGIHAYFEKSLSDAFSAGDIDIKETDIPEIASALLAYYEGILILARAQNNADIIRMLSRRALNLINRNQ